MKRLAAALLLVIISILPAAEAALVAVQQPAVARIQETIHLQPGDAVAPHAWRLEAKNTQLTITYNNPEPIMYETIALGTTINTSITMTLDATIESNDTIAPHLYDWYFDGNGYVVYNGYGFPQDNFTDRFTVVFRFKDVEYTTWRKVVSFSYGGTWQGLGQFGEGGANDYYAQISNGTNSFQSIGYGSNIGNPLNWKWSPDGFYTVAWSYDAVNGKLYGFRDDGVVVSGIAEGSAYGDLVGGFTQIWVAKAGYWKGYIGYIYLSLRMNDTGLLNGSYVVDKPTVLLDPSFYNGSAYFDLVNNIAGTPHGNVARIPTNHPWLWLVKDLASDNLVHLRFFPYGSIVYFYDSNGNLVKRVVISGTPNAAGLVEDYAVNLPAGTYHVVARIPRRVIIAPHLYDWFSDNTTTSGLYVEPGFDPGAYKKFMVCAATYGLYDAGRLIVYDDNNPNGGWALSYGDAGAGRFRFYYRGSSLLLIDTGVYNVTKEHVVCGFRDTIGRKREILVDGVVAASGNDDNYTAYPSSGLAIGSESTSSGEYSASRLGGYIEYAYMVWRSGNTTLTRYAPLTRSSYVEDVVLTVNQTLIDPTFYNGSAYLSITDSHYAVPYPGTQRVPAKNVWLWVVDLGPASDGRGFGVYLDWFPAGSVVEIGSSNFTVTGREVFAVLGPGSYTVKAWIPVGWRGLGAWVSAEGSGSIVSLSNGYVLSIGPGSFVPPGGSAASISYNRWFSVFFNGSWVSDSGNGSVGRPRVYFPSLDGSGGFEGSLGYLVLYPGDLYGVASAYRGNHTINASWVLVDPVFLAGNGSATPPWAGYRVELSGEYTRVPDSEAWLWVVRGAYSDGLVHFVGFPPGTILEVFDSDGNTVVAHVVDERDYAVRLEPGTYKVYAAVPLARPVAPRVEIDFYADRVYGGASLTTSGLVDDGLLYGNMSSGYSYALIPPVKAALLVNVKGYFSANVLLLSGAWLGFTYNGSYLNATIHALNDTDSASGPAPSLEKLLVDTSTGKVLIYALYNGSWRYIGGWDIDSAISVVALSGSASAVLMRGAYLSAQVVPGGVLEFHGWDANGSEVHLRVIDNGPNDLDKAPGRLLVYALLLYPVRGVFSIYAPAFQTVEYAVDLPVENISARVGAAGPPGTGGEELRGLSATAPWSDLGNYSWLPALVGAAAVALVFPPSLAHVAAVAYLGALGAAQYMGLVSLEPRVWGLMVAVAALGLALRRHEAL